MYLKNDTKAEKAVKLLSEDLIRRLESNTISNCPIDMCKAFVTMCLSQSCGKCVPCRIGLKQIVLILDKILSGKGEMSDIDELKNLSNTIYDSADCAIGFDSAKYVKNVIESFEDDFISHINKNRCTAKFAPVPCKEACPAHVDIPGYIALVKDERYDDAVNLIRYDNPFVSACALVCEHPCEFSCRRNMIDDSINIRAIKRMAVDNANMDKKVPLLDSTSKKVAIIGGGPSGLSCAYYLQQLGHKCTVFEQRAKLGGMLRYGIPRYRLPDEYLDKDINHILDTGIEVKLNTRIDKDNFNKLKEEFDAIYISIGAHNSNSLRIDGEDAENVLSAVTLLRKMGDNDKPDFENKDVVIIGGGNVAMDCTRTAIRLGAKSVKCVYRRRQKDMTALDEEIEGAIAETCEIVTMMAPVRIEKDENGKVKSLIVQPQIPGEYDRGRPKPVKAQKDEVEIPCDIIVGAIGQSIDSSDFDELGIPTNRGKLSTDKACKIDNDFIIYAGGDCQSGPLTVIRAVEAGKTAACNINEDLGFNTKIERTIDIPNASSILTSQHGRINLDERPAFIRKSDFNIMEFEMTKEEACAECSRCLRCDHHGMGAVKGGRASW